MSGAADPIADRSQTFVQSMRKGDVSTLVDIFEDDVVFMPPADVTIVGKARVRDWYDDYFAHFVILNLDITEREVTVVGECLVERTAVSVKLEPRKGGTPIYDE